MDAAASPSTLISGRFFPESFPPTAMRRAAGVGLRARRHANITSFTVYKLSLLSSPF